MKNNIYLGRKFDRMSYQGIRFALYVLIVVLLNAALGVVSLRFDLSEQKTYSLAGASSDTVARLEEPVTIRVYLSRNLPARYNILSSLLRDLLQSYSGSARRGMFSYSVNLIGSNDKSAKSQKFQQEAEGYGIYPIQLQGADGNELKVLSAYVGLAISQGDNLEVISPLRPEDNIQYTITAALEKMSRKSSALLSLSENLKIYYYFSPVLAEFDQGQYAAFPDNFREVMKTAGEKLYGKLESRVIDPAELPSGLPEPGELKLQNTEIDTANGVKQNVYSAIVIDNGGRYRAFSLLQLQPTLELGPEGLTQSNSVSLIDPQQLEGQLPDLATSILGIAQNIGYIADRETASFNPPNPQQPPQGANLYQFAQEARDLYRFEPVMLDQGIGKDINILLLVDPKKQLSDWDLYQIDQFLMRGGKLLAAMEPYQVLRNPYGYGAQYIPNPNIGGIEGENAQQYTLVDLLSHYGIVYEKALVFDKRSFIQRGQNPQTGGYQETQVYYIPEINTRWGSEFPFIRDLKKLYSYNSAPLLAKESGEDFQTSVLLQSSPESWIEDMSEGNKDPNNIFPPPSDKLSQRNLIMASTGPLTSFFAGKSMPERPKEEDSETPGQTDAPEDTLDLAAIQGAFIDKGERGQVLVSGTSLLFDSQLLNWQPNKALALNLIDYLAGNLGMANLRARSGTPNFIDEQVGNTQKNLIKWFNVLVLPFLVGIWGLLMLLNWRSRQMQFRTLFSKISNQNHE